MVSMENNNQKENVSMEIYVEELDEEEDGVEFEEKERFYNNNNNFEESFMNYERKLDVTAKCLKFQKQVDDNLEGMVSSDVEMQVNGEEYNLCGEGTLEQEGNQTKLLISQAMSQRESALSSMIEMGERVFEEAQRLEKQFINHKEARDASITDLKEKGPRCYKRRD